MEDQAVDFVGEVGECDLRLADADADGVDEQSLPILMTGKYVLDARTAERLTLAPDVRVDIALPLGFLPWSRLTRPIDSSHVSLARLR